MVEIISERMPWQPGPLKKPAELKGVKQAFSVSTEYKRKFPVYIHGEDLWIKHRAWCCMPGSEIENARFREKHGKFVYCDCFGGTLYAGTAWIRLRGALAGRKVTDVLWTIVSETLIAPSRFCNDDCRLMTDAVTEARRRCECAE